MAWRAYIIGLIAVTCWFGCEEPVVFDLGPEANKLVVISNFSDLDTLEVVVSRSISVQSQDPYEYLSNAQVELLVDNKVVDELRFVPPINDQIPGYYRSNFVVPELGVLYMIKVSVPELEPAMAFNAIPEEKIAIDTSSVTFELNREEQDDSRTLANFSITLNIDDPLPSTDFYHLTFYQEAFNYKVIAATGDTIKERFYSLPLSLETKNEDIPQVPYIDSRGVLLQDKTFNGERLTLRYEGSFIFDSNTQLLGDFIIELRTTSEAYFQYHSTLARQYQSSQDPLSDPVILYGNIENGYGIFAGFTTSFYVLDLVQDP